MAYNPALMNSLYSRQPALQKSNVAPIGSSITNPLKMPTGGVRPPLPGIPRPDMSKVGGVIGPPKSPLPIGPFAPPRIPPTGTGGPIIGTKPGMSNLPLHLQQPVTGGTPPLGAPIPPSNPGNLGPMMPSFGFGGTKIGRAIAGGVPPAGQSNNGKLLTSLVGNK